MNYQSLAASLDLRTTSAVMGGCSPSFPHPEIVSRSEERFESVHRIPFTYFNLFPTPIVCERIEHNDSPPISTSDFIESVISIIPPSLVVEDVLVFSESVFIKNFPNLFTSFTIVRIFFLMCVISTIKLTSDGSCNGILAKASEVVIGSSGQPRFRLRQDELEKIELWYVCEFFNERGIL